MFISHFISNNLHTQYSRIPILFELRGKSPANLSPAELLGAWAQQYRIQALALIKLLAAGRLILIFEGFDEMGNISNAESRIEQFRALWRFSYPNAKLLFTGRANLFFEEKEVEVVFPAQRDGPRPSCKIFRLNPFSVDQIRSSLRWVDNSTRDEIIAVAGKNPQLFDIIARPSLLYIVGLLWPQLKELLISGGITSADVIGRFVEHSYRRQAEKALGAPAFMQLLSGERRYFHEGIACEMAVNLVPNQISREDFTSAVGRLYDSYPDSTSLIPSSITEPKLAPLKVRLRDFDSKSALETVLTDVRTHGVIVTDPARQGSFRFAHKSFFEFLAAKAAAYSLLGIDPEFYGAIRSASGGTTDVTRSREILVFFGEIIVKNFQRDPSTRGRSIEALVFDRMMGIDRFSRPITFVARNFIIWTVRFFGVLDRSLDQIGSTLVSVTRKRGLPVTVAYIAIGLAFLTFGFGLALAILSDSDSDADAFFIIPGAIAIAILTPIYQFYGERALRTTRRWFACLKLGGRSNEQLEQFLGSRTISWLFHRRSQGWAPGVVSSPKAEQSPSEPPVQVTPASPT
jgi:hypothetical protein